MFYTPFDDSLYKTYNDAVSATRWQTLKNGAFLFILSQIIVVLGLFGIMVVFKMPFILVFFLTFVLMALTIRLIMENNYREMYIIDNQTGKYHKVMFLYITNHEYEKYMSMSSNRASSVKLRPRLQIPVNKFMKLYREYIKRG